MGRKKSNRPVSRRQLPTIPRIFDCPRCEATAIRISMQSDIALVECGNCLLKQTVTNLKSIEEPVDIFGSFVDEYYKNIDLQEMGQPESEVSIEASETHTESQTGESSSEELLEEQEVTESEGQVEEQEEEEEHEEPVTVGFVPRAKGDVLKSKHKEKDNKKKKLNLSSLGKE